jgi:hypothetical protein
VTSARQLTLQDNIIESPNNDLLLPWILNNFGRNEDPTREIYLENVDTDIGVDEEKSLVISVLGNPFKEVLSLEFSDQLDVAYSIYNLLGWKVYSSTIGRERTHKYFWLGYGYVCFKN